MAEKKFFDKVKFFMGMNSDGSEDYEDDDLAEDSGQGFAKSSQPTASSLYPTSGVSQASAGSRSSGSYQNSSYQSAVASQNTSKLVNINKGASNIKVVIYQPRTFDDTKAIVDNLKNKKPVILNIEVLDKDLAQKIFNFCSGALYALDGHIQQISKGIFILAPANVDVTGDVKSELESKGVFSWSGGSRE
jgi:cell division inhibitor SepF